MSWITPTQNVKILTWTRDSGKPIFIATSSRIKMSGYFVLPNNPSKMSNWARVNVVRSRRCFRGGPKILCHFYRKSFKKKLFILNYLCEIDNFESKITVLQKISSINRDPISLKITQNVVFGSFLCQIWSFSNKNESKKSIFCIWKRGRKLNVEMKSILGLRWDKRVLW